MSKDQTNLIVFKECYKYLKLDNTPETFAAYIWFLLMIKTAYDKKK